MVVGVRPGPWSLWVPPVAWMALIFLGSSLPTADLPVAPKWISLLVHLLEFAVLALLLLRGANGGFGRRARPAALAVAFLASVAYAVGDELHQLFVPGRIPDLTDVMADTAGAAAACILAAVALAFIHRRASD